MLNAGGANGDPGGIGGASMERAIRPPNLAGAERPRFRTRAQPLPIRLMAPSAKSISSTLLRMLGVSRTCRFA